jgi:hypothetical protein
VEIDRARLAALGMEGEDRVFSALGSDFIPQDGAVIFGGV